MEILLSFRGTKLPVEVTEEQLAALKSGNGEIQISATLFPDGIKVKLSNDGDPDEIVYVAKAISATIA